MNPPDADSAKKADKGPDSSGEVDQPIEPEGLSPQEEEIAAYVAGTLETEARLGFERRMESDPALKREVESSREALAGAREWLDQAPPGLDRVAQLPIPAIPAASVPSKTGLEERPASRARVIPIRRVVLRYAAAAAIFVLGVAVGKWMATGDAGTASGPTPPSQISTGPQTAPPQGPVVVPGDLAPAPAPVAPESRKPEAPKPPTRSEPSTQLAGITQGAAPPITRSTVEPDGRVVIETTLASTGSQAVWVIDGSFQLAQTNSSPTGGSR